MPVENLSTRQENSKQPWVSLQRKTFELLGVKIDVLDTGGLVERVLEFADSDEQHIIMYVNADCMLIAQEKKTYLETLNRADLVYADGIGVILGARLWGAKLPGRSTAADFFPDFCRRAAAKKKSFFFLGAKKGVARRAAERLKKEIPDLTVVGTHHGYFDRRDTQRIIDDINAAKPDIVIVGLGAPFQELWIHEYGARLDSSVLWGVGGLFDFLSGNTRRGPQWLLDNGFEWLCRLVIEPRRLWRRYLFGNARFVLLLLRHRFFPK